MREAGTPSRTMMRKSGRFSHETQTMQVSVSQTALVKSRCQWLGGQTKRISGAMAYAAVDSVMSLPPRRLQIEYAYRCSLILPCPTTFCGRKPM